jgi:hypothetical protein
MEEEAPVVPVQINCDLPRTTECVKKADAVLEVPVVDARDLFKTASEHVLKSHQSRVPQGGGPIRRDLNHPKSGTIADDAHVEDLMLLYTGRIPAFTKCFLLRSPSRTLVKKVHFFFGITARYVNIIIFIIFC